MEMFESIFEFLFCKKFLHRNIFMSHISICSWGTNSLIFAQTFAAVGVPVVTGSILTFNLKKNRTC